MDLDKTYICVSNWIKVLIELFLPFILINQKVRVKKKWILLRLYGLKCSATDLHFKKLYWVPA